MSEDALEDWKTSGPSMRSIPTDTENYLVVQFHHYFPAL